MQKTAIHFDEVITECRDLFSKKLQDYGAAWRVLRPSSVTDQIFIKINRIRTLQITGVKMVDEDEREEFMAIINYSVIGLIQFNQGIGTAESWEHDSWEIEEILNAYDSYVSEAKTLMVNKNHDYGEAWRDMRISSITDMIFQKVLRLKQIENNKGKTIISEGIEANYYDILNYAAFCLIKIDNFFEYL